jgi:hypothetical protein
LRNYYLTNYLTTYIYNIVRTIRFNSKEGCDRAYKELKTGKKDYEINGIVPFVDIIEGFVLGFGFCFLE